jgi:hypothetical protein
MGVLKYFIPLLFIPTYAFTANTQQTVAVNSSAANPLACKLVSTLGVFYDASGGGSSGGLTDTQLRATPVPVSGTFYQSTQPVSIASMPSTPVTGTFWQATQPVSIASMPSTPVTGTFWQATQPVSGTVTANQGGTWTVQPGNTANTTAWKVDGSAVTQPVSGTVTVTPPTLTLGTQGATGFSTQDLKDAGRSARTITLDGFAIAATSETLHTMSYSADNAAATTGTSYSVTVGKRLRLQQFVGTLHTIAGNTTAITCIIRIRANAAGAAIVTSPVQFVTALPGVSAANQSAGPVVTQFPDGWEFAASTGIGVTSICPGFVATTAAPKLNISITGYQY